jgi:hypothetical protein
MSAERMTDSPLNVGAKTAVVSRLLETSRNAGARHAGQRVQHVLLPLGFTTL